ncbi:MAG: hypothetical protein H8D78_09415 [Chloroflexi bacterium]|nr:hypothetical protein [Chloroflexota bacterium]
MQQTVRQVNQFVGVEGFPLSQRIKEISEKVKIIRFGIVYETKGSPWDRLAGMFTVSRPVDIEEMLDARGFEETADYL